MFEVGDRVFYSDCPVADTGTVIGVSSYPPAKYPIQILWDYDGTPADPGWYTTEALVKVEPK